MLVKKVQKIFHKQNLFLIPQKIWRGEKKMPNKVKNCPVCKSLEYYDCKEGKCCKNCGFTDKDKVRGKIVVGPLHQNWWMT